MIDNNSTIGDLQHRIDDYLREHGASALGAISRSCWLLMGVSGAMAWWLPNGSQAPAYPFVAAGVLGTVWLVAADRWRELEEPDDYPVRISGTVTDVANPDDLDDLEMQLGEGWIDGDERVIRVCLDRSDKQPREGRLRKWWVVAHPSLTAEYRNLVTREDIMMGERVDLDARPRWVGSDVLAPVEEES
jgi:hypothetical protein